MMKFVVLIFGSSSFVAMPSTRAQTIDFSVCPEKYEPYANCMIEAGLQSNDCVTEAAYGTKEPTLLQVNSLTCDVVENNGFCENLAKCTACQEFFLDYIDCSSVANNCGFKCSVTSRKKFCQDLSSLEAHLTNRFIEEGVTDIRSGEGYKCSCSLQPDDQSFQINCSLEYKASEIYINEENMVFELNEGGVYELTQSSWSDTYYGSNLPHEVYNLEDGEVISCQAPSCNSCTVYEKIIAIDCSNLSNGRSYESDCDGDHTGSFAESYQFGVVTKDEKDTSSAANVSIFQIMMVWVASFLVCVVAPV